MFCLEDKFRPPDSPARRWARDLHVVGLLVLLAIVLLPTLGINWDLLTHPAQSVDQADERAANLSLFVKAVTGPMASIWMLMALGMLLCLRCGVLDLSTWALAGLGGVLSAWAINAGWPPIWAFLAAILCGAALGGANGLLVGLARLPSVIVTTATGVAVVLWCQGACAPARDLIVPVDAFQNYLIEQTVQVQTTELDGHASAEPQAEQVSRPLYLTRMLGVVILYAAVLVAILVWRRFHPAGPVGWRGRRVLALLVAGGLSAAAGALWLLDQGSTPVPTRLIGDLRVPATAVLAGSLLLAGSGRVLLACVCLPVACLVVSTWRQDVWVAHLAGYDAQLLLLIGMLLASQASLAAWVKMTPRWGRRIGAAGVIATVAGIVLAAISGRVESPAAQAGLLAAGLIGWSGGTAVTAAAAVYCAKVAKNASI